MMRALKNPKVLTALIFVVLILLVWFAGGFLGMEKRESRIIAVFILMVLWVIVLLVGQALAKRSSGLIERMLRKDADSAVINASPEARAEISQIRQQLLNAIETLKTSNLGRTRGKAALYELPWYMIMGHASAGKSCAIRYSGLKFPMAGKGQLSVPGVGGTRNCDWFFSTEGVLLDTAGRYSNQTKDKDEWLAFLRLLKKHRSKAPINGIIVAISLPELINYRQESFLEYGKQIRQRINEVDELFQMKVPVYLMVTKMDLLGGFSSFFEDFDEEERRKVWGATLPHDQPASFDLTRAVLDHFDALHRGLVQMGQDRLAGNRDNLARPALYAYPIEFQGLRNAFERLMEILSEKDPYHTRPLLRGMYFTSSLQEGQPTNSRAMRVAQMFGLDFNAHSAHSGKSQSFFLEHLFRQVIFPDQYLAVSKAQPQRNRAKAIGLLSGLAVLGLLTGVWTLSYVKNQKLIKEFANDRANCRHYLNSSQLSERLGALQLLQLRLEQLQGWKRDGRPMSYGWGLYQGDKLEKALKADYYQGIRELMLIPVQERLEWLLERFVQGDTTALAEQSQIAKAGDAAQSVQEAAYNALKTYLMLEDRAHLEATHLSDQLARNWRPHLERAFATENLDAGSSRVAERTIAYYVGALEDPELPTLVINRELVKNVRTRLHGEIQFLSPFERVYNQIKAQANTQFAPVSVGSILENKNLDLMGGSAVVPGAFTRESWEKFIQKALRDAAEGKFKGSDWVLDSAVDNDLKRHAPPDECEAKLLALYKADYIKEWERFITGIALLGFDDGEKSASALNRLSDRQASPIKLVLARAAKETAWDNPGEMAKRVEGLKKSVVERTYQMLGTAPAASQAGPAFGEVGGRYAHLAKLVGNGKDPAPLDGYLELLQKLGSKLSSVATGPEPTTAAHQLMQSTLGGGGSEFNEALRYVDTVMLGQADEATKTPLRAIFLRPLMQSAGALAPLVEQSLNQAWSQQVYGAWHNLSSKYPFTNTSNDAILSDIIRFLKPGEGTLARFVDRYLMGLVSRNGDSYTPRSFGGIGVEFSQGFLKNLGELQAAGRHLLSEGEVCQFELSTLPTVGATKTILELQGQRINYFNGPAFWTNFKWPNPNGASGIHVRLEGENGASFTVHNHQGRLDLMRWLDSARIENPDGPNTLLIFQLPNGHPIASMDRSRIPREVKYSFRMVSGTNPLKLKNLRNKSLPSRIIR